MKREQLDAIVLGCGVAGPQICRCTTAVDVALGATAQICLHLLGNNSFVVISRFDDHIGSPHREVVAGATLGNFVDGAGANGAGATRCNRHTRTAQHA